MQKLLVCRVGPVWAYRDVTGATYGHSPHIQEAVQAARTTAERRGGEVKFSVEAEQQYRSLTSVQLDKVASDKANRQNSVRVWIHRIARAAKQSSDFMR